MGEEGAHEPHEPLLRVGLSERVRLLGIVQVRAWNHRKRRVLEEEDLVHHERRRVGLGRRHRRVFRQARRSPPAAGAVAPRVCAQQGQG